MPFGRGLNVQCKAPMVSKSSEIVGESARRAMDANAIENHIEHWHRPFDSMAEYFRMQTGHGQTHYWPSLIVV